MNLQELFAEYEDRLSLVEQEIGSFFDKNVSVISLVGNHIFTSGGKRLRPLIHLISAEISNYSGKASIEIAAIIELIHTASLLHDDVVDMAELRRGRPSANAIWGNQLVILVGDFLYSSALRAAVMQKNQKIMEALSFATTRMTEGELLQLSRISDPDLSEREYVEIISAKTGALISAACKIGAILGERSEREEIALFNFGMKTGMAFQMADDILDYRAQEEDLGKKICKDLEEGKITLPLLHALSIASISEQDEVKKILKKDLSPLDASKIIELLEKYNSIDVSLQKARQIVDEAKSELSCFDDSSAKRALFTIADYALEREK